MGGHSQFPYSYIQGHECPWYIYIYMYICIPFGSGCPGATQPAMQPILQHVAALPEYYQCVWYIYKGNVIFHWCKQIQYIKKVTHTFSHRLYIITWKFVRKFICTISITLMLFFQCISMYLQQSKTCWSYQMRLTKFPLGPKVKRRVFPITLPTLTFCPYPNLFIVKKCNSFILHAWHTKYLFAIMYWETNIFCLGLGTQWGHVQCDV